MGWRSGANVAAADRGERLSGAAAAILFVVFFHDAIQTLVRDWLSDPDASHGLIAFPMAVYFAWKSGLSPDRRADIVAGGVLTASGVGLGVVSALAAELFTMRLAMVVAGAGILVSAWGLPQLARWWLPTTLLVLSIPLPSTVMASLALPLQLQASRIGASLLEWRQVPVALSGNVIDIPGRSLFVTEACSGLRSLTALLTIGLVLGGTWLRTVWARGALLALTLPIAILMNGIRVFLTAFLIHYVDPSLGDAVMHYTEGWVLFGVSFTALAAIAMGLTWAERTPAWWPRGGRRADEAASAA